MLTDLILVNPWIHDFAAYDLWSKPLGLLELGACLKQAGFKIHLIDCLDVHHPKMKSSSTAKFPTRRKFGTGKFWRQKISRPPELRHINRPYSRYGLSIEIFEEELQKVKDPAAILVTSLMTYWYPGVHLAIKTAKRIHPDVPVILGGIYASLCHKHALEKSGADHVINDSEPEALLKVLKSYGISSPGSITKPMATPYPAFDLLHGIDYICLLTSTGCPYRCQYCASNFLTKKHTQKDADDVLKEILYWHQKFGIKDFAFYDDALLLSSNSNISTLLEGLVKCCSNLRFHTPNALHVKGITPQIAKLMRLTGFETIRLGLETSDFSLHRSLDKKVMAGEFEQAVHYLIEAGFKNTQIGAYLLVGLPEQSVQSVIETIELIASVGAMPFLAEYSPIPHTGLWEKAVACSEYDLASEPMFHNNTLLPCWNASQKKEIHRLKSLTLKAREMFR